MKVISYSLFGWNKTYQNSFDFNTYLRGLAINVRMARLLYPDWVIRLQTDKETFDRWGALFMAYGIETQINEPAPLCKAMLWRLKPVFDAMVERVICRDLDSPLTLRERKCVQEWINEGKIGHAITDSISHTIPMMGGMIGFYSKYFKDATGIATFEQLFEGCNLDFNIKGTDQTLLNNVIYPKLAQHGTDSITQHYILGMPNTFLSGYHNTVPDLDCGDYEGSNDSCGHIGAAGFYEAPAFKFFRQYKDKFKDIIEAERAYPLIFNWNE